MKTYNILFAFLFILNSIVCSQQKSVIWIIDNTDSIGSYNINYIRPISENYSQSRIPFIIDTELGKALKFNGIDEGIIVDGNPMKDWDEFTIEMIIKPDSSSIIENFEQRFFHLRSKENDTRRILIELRLLSKNRWSLDTFIKSDNSSCTLLDTLNFSHPVNIWHHVALTYANGIMSHYVNGNIELSGKVNYIPIENGQISIGARQDPRSWFKGIIKLVKFSNSVLEPSEFIDIKKIRCVN